MTTAAECPACPLCGNRGNDPFFTSKIRPYWRCPECALVFVPQAYWLSAEEEKATYDLHENQVQDQGYRSFLSRLTEPLVEKLKPNQQGLDFGCGPGPALAKMLEERGHRVDLFDLYYHNDPRVFTRHYDFICASEVVEHLHDPNQEFTRIFSILKPDGWLAIMTKLVSDKQAFSQWHYIRDLTHICFYSQNTFEYLAQRFNAEIDFAAKDVILLHKR